MAQICRTRFNSFCMLLFIICILIALLQLTACSRIPSKKEIYKFKGNVLFNRCELPKQESVIKTKRELSRISKVWVNEDLDITGPELAPILTVEKSYNGKSSSCPPVVPGKLRLYSMRFCPFCERDRLVLHAKGIPYETVNINLKDKPDWLFGIHPEGKVPALDTGDEVVIESLDIANFLDAEYPSPPLYPADEAKKAHEKELIEKYGKVVGAAGKAIYNVGNQPMEVYVTDIVTPLQDFEDELAKRGTTFFGGSAPGMLDYMMWPWVERFEVPAAMRNEEFTFPWDTIPALAEWAKSMKSVSPVQATFIDKDTHVKFLRGYFGETPEFDNI